MIMLFNDDLCEYVDQNKESIIDDLKNNDTETNETNIYDQARNDIECYFAELRGALSFYDSMNECKIKAVAILGLWYGKRKAQKVFNNLYDAVLKCFEDVNALYFDNKRTTLTLRATHHDGENIIKFYAIKKGKSYAIKHDDILGGL